MCLKSQSAGFKVPCCNFISSTALLLLLSLSLFAGLAVMSLRWCLRVSSCADAVSVVGCSGVMLASELRIPRVTKSLDNKDWSQ